MAASMVYLIPWQLQGRAEAISDINFSIGRGIQASIGVDIFDTRHLGITWT